MLILLLVQWCNDKHVQLAVSMRSCHKMAYALARRRSQDTSKQQLARSRLHATVCVPQANRSVRPSSSDARVRSTMELYDWTWMLAKDR